MVEKPPSMTSEEAGRIIDAIHRAAVTIGFESLEREEGILFTPETFRQIGREARESLDPRRTFSPLITGEYTEAMLLAVVALIERSGGDPNPHAVLAIVEDPKYL
jgi:hypothetical protein